MDAVDRKILSALRANGRASFSSIGEQVNLSPHGTADRIRRLERDGVITGYEVRLDPARAGRPITAIVDVRVLSSADPADFERTVGDLPAVEEMAFVTGRFDYQLELACADSEELDRTVSSIRGAHCVAGTETKIVMRRSSFDRDPERVFASRRSA